MRRSPSKRCSGFAIASGTAVLFALLACSSGSNNAGTPSGSAGTATAVAGANSGAGAGAVSGSSSATAGGGSGGTQNAAGGAGAGLAAGGSSLPMAGSAGSAGVAGSGGVGGLGGHGGATGGQSGGGQSMGGNAGASAYQPCPTDGSSCLILPFGDSITDGVKSTDLAGYRSPLFKRIVAGGQKVSFIGSRSSGPAQVSGQNFPANHEGHPGWTIDSGYVSFGDGISTLIPMPAFKTIPHIVLLMIGTNDVGASMGTDMIANRLDTLLEKIVQAAPNALVVVAQLTPISYQPAPLATYNSKIPGVIKARADKGQHLVGVDMSKMPVSDLGSDGLHPSDTGYAYMADVWYKAITDVLPK